MAPETLNRVPFLRRTVSMSWLVALMIIALFVEYHFFDFVVKDSGDVAVYNALSFAGTLVSIVLAILAIIYTYFQGSSDSSASFILSAQLRQLEKITKQVSDQVKELLDAQKELTSTHTELKFRTVYPNPYEDEKNVEHKFASETGLGEESAGIEVHSALVKNTNSDEGVGNGQES